MSAVQYPFIDVAVHDRVRGRFARGEALVIFSAGMDEVLWANGPGAAVFGGSSVYDFIDQAPPTNDLTFRQAAVMARSLERTGDARSFLIRVPNGFQRSTVRAEAEMIRIGMDEAILLSVPAVSEPKGPQATAARMIEGFDDPDTHVAILDENGFVLASSGGFAGLGMSADTVQTLAGNAADEPARLLKRRLETGRGLMPAAIGRLAEQPNLYLLFVIETPQQANDEDAPLPPTDNDMPFAEEAVDGSADAAEPMGTISDETDGMDPEEVSSEAPTEIDPQTAEPIEPSAKPASLMDLLTDDPSVEIPPMTLSDIPVAPSSPSDAPAMDAGEHSATPIENFIAPEPSKSDFRFNPEGRAIRFVWKVDADGHFCEVSDEFAEAVGPNAAAINGVAFSDLAHLFDLDPDGKITELLKKRDTWSGKTIYWPVEGTSLKVPVDLAALPTYSRSRGFDGFRGFGIVRRADAVEDPLATGLTLGGKSLPAEIESNSEAPEIATPEALETVTPEELGQTAVTDTEPAHDGQSDAHAGDVTEDTVEQPAADDGIERSPETIAPTPQSEPPALHLTENPERRLSDKIIRLEEHRARMNDGLSPGEQAAFREIAKRLGTEEAPAEVEQVVSAEDAAEVTSQTEAPIEAEDAAPETPAEEQRDANPLGDFLPPRRDMASPLPASAIDEMPVAILIHAGDRLIHANGEFSRLTGYETLDALETAGGLDALLQRSELEETSDAGGGMMIVRADDTVVPVAARLRSIRFEDSDALMLALIPSAPVTAQEQTAPAEDTSGTILPFVGEDAASENEDISRLRIEVEELRSILETATDGVVIIGPEGGIRSMNRSASALFNYDEADTRGKPFAMLFAHESQRAVADYLNGLTDNGVASVLNDGREVIGRESGGGFIPLFMTLGRLSSSDGYCAVIRDVTNWKRTEEELRKAKRDAETANKHKSDFLAHVSHEIRTPLNAIIGFSDMMSNERFGPIGHHRYIEYANDIGRSGRLVLDIVNDLLDISKIEAGQMEMDFAAVSLNETLSETVSLMQPQANNQRVIVRTALSQAVPMVVADLRSVKQIALNILSNAIRFTPSGGQIVVSTSYEVNGSVVLRIRDTGIGMSKSELEQAMKPFRQVSGGSRQKGDGTGLGLPLTKAMVEANRAAFSIQSEPSRGTLVEITFPSPRVLAD
ncbi:ATP-binding protein [Rhizobium sp. NRK18]|uniref:ATP-binding protein n=1 Tax=Rhizobium sp. NRK18 TaxID=2964667 RepID=UPI0021C346F8|nr:ATP-binding protein [Rhizobium sp. NRK18]MCQ2005286.1 ATP-binding protein [Rhizobium sp. NRK18]